MYWATYTLLLQKQLEIHAMKLPTYNFGAHVNASRGLGLYSYGARRALATSVLSVTPSYNFIWFDTLWLVVSKRFHFAIPLITDCRIFRRKEIPQADLLQW